MMNIVSNRQNALCILKELVENTEKIPASIIRFTAKCEACDLYMALLVAIQCIEAMNAESETKKEYD